MTPELVDKLNLDHPKLFPKKLYPECGDGWYDLINTLCSSIEQVEHTHTEYRRRKGLELKEHTTVLQIKEKFGSLRFYCVDTTDRSNGMIHLASNLSVTICEICGAKGSLRNKNGFLVTMCDKHDKDFK